VQAKAIARAARDPAPGEVFIAALLYRLGDMAFWCFADQGTVKALRAARSLPLVSETDAEHATLGFSLRQLTAGLAQAWRLGDVLEDALRPGREAADPRAARVLLGHELETAVRLHGWESAAVTRVTKKIAAHTQCSLKQAHELVLQTREELQRAGDSFGLRLDLEHRQKKPSSPRPEPRQPEPLLQLKVLRELSAVLEKRPSVQLVLDMVLEGIYRGIGMDCTVLAVCSTDRRQMKVKYVLGTAGDTLLATLQQPQDCSEAASVRRMLGCEQPIWRKESEPDPLQLGIGEYFVGPLAVKGRDIGLIYADCQQSDRRLDQDSLDSFRHFPEQANLALAHLARA
jgi:hypothetical protein